MKVNYRKDISLQQTRKVVNSSKKVNTYANVVQKTSPDSTNNNQLENYRAPFTKLAQLCPKDWPKFP